MLYSIIKTITPKFLKDSIYRVLNIKIIKYIRIRYSANAIYKKYLSENSIKKLNIGCGKNQLKGWLNTDYSPTSSDIAFINAEKKLPFNDNTFDYIYTEHLIEHLEYSKAKFFLEELYRVCKNKGRVRIVTPNLTNFINLFVKNKSTIQEGFINWVSENFLVKRGIHSKNDAFILDQYIRGWGHKFLYDYQTLSETMISVGFLKCTEFRINDSKDPSLQNIEMHGIVINNIDMNEFESLVVEAVKI